MGYDIGQLKFVPPAKRRMLEAELEEAEWARFGRNVYDLMQSRRMVTAVQTALLAGGSATTIAHRLLVFLTTGTIAR